MIKKEKLILDYYFIGDEPEATYGLKLSESIKNPATDRAGELLLPVHPHHTRFQFAKIRANEIIIEMGERAKHNYSIHGTYMQNSLGKIMQCERIMNHYCKF